MNNKRKHRPSLTRSRSPESISEGVFSNSSFLSSVTGFIGTNVQIDTTDGSRYGGVFSAFSSQFEIVLDYAFLIHAAEHVKPETKSLTKRMVFRLQNVVNVDIDNVDPYFASRDGGFQTDANISKYDRNGQVLGEKELQPWDSECNGEEIEMGFGSGTGWDAHAMFEINEKRYGVQSDFDHSLVGLYTTPIDRSDAKGFKEAEARAARIASEIEKNPKTHMRLELENGDEEDRFAAVVRPGDDRGDRSSPPKQDKAGKYLPPTRRPPGSTQGRLISRSTPFPSPSPTGPSPPAPTTVEHVSDPPTPTTPTSNCDDNRNNNSPSSGAPTPPIRNINNNNNTRGKPGVVPGYGGYIPAPRHQLPPTGHQVLRAMPPQPIAVYPQPIPPNHPHQNAIPAPLPPHESVSQPPVPVQPAQNIAMLHSVEPVQHVHLPPHGVPHAHAPPAYALPHEVDGRSQRPMPMRQQSPRVYQQQQAPHNNKRLPSPYQEPPAPLPQRKSRSEEVADLVEFGTNLKLASEDPESHEDKQESPTIEQWQKNPSNSSSEDTSSTLKSTLNPNAKEFVYNPSAKPFTPRPPNTPGQSRPHTPQTPAQPQTFGYSPGPAVIMPAYVMQQTYQSSPPRLQMAPRPEISSSQMQVAAATGQPLLTPAPMQRFVAPYPNQPPPPYQQMVRMVHGQTPVLFHPEGTQHVQYVSQHGPQHPGAGQFPQQPPQYPVVYSLPISQNTMLPTMYYPQPHHQPGKTVNMNTMEA